MGIQKQRIIYLSLGSNLGEQLRNLERCVELITIHVGDITGRSGVYKSDPWGFESDHTFYNICLEVETELTPEGVMDKIFEIENLLGRTRSAGGYSDRLIDIDLLFFNSTILNSDLLIVPHPRIEERRFVLEPLAEINPAFIHPILHRSVAELLKDCKDKNRVELI